MRAHVKQPNRATTAKLGRKRALSHLGINRVEIRRGLENERRGEHGMVDRARVHISTLLGALFLAVVNTFIVFRISIQ